MALSVASREAAAWTQPRDPSTAIGSGGLAEQTGWFAKGRPLRWDRQAWQGPCVLGMGVGRAMLALEDGQDWRGRVGREGRAFQARLL